METELQKSYIELLDRIKAEARDNDQILPELNFHFLPYFPPEKKSILERILGQNKRKQSKINSIDDLLHYVEAKNIISKQNITHLKFVVDKLDNERIKFCYENHETLLLHFEQKCSTPVARSVGLNKTVREMVCHGISKRWKNLGRELGLADEDIEQIEHKHKHEDFALCANKILDCFEQQTDPSEHINLLHRALTAAKRKDLADKIKPYLEAKDSF